MVRAVKPVTCALFVALSLFATACAPGPRSQDNDGNGDGGPGSSSQSCTSSGCENTPALCSDGIDNDNNGVTDCSDPNCSGIGDCPVCGMIMHPMGDPFALPDGADQGKQCRTNADCTDASEPNCIDGLPTPTCAASYTSTVMFTGFAQGHAFAPNDIVSVCVNMEHSYLGDLQIEVVAPTGELLEMQEFQGEGATPEIYLGIPVDDESKPNVPGTGWNYCWTPDATNAPMVMWAAANGYEGNGKGLPAGNYQTSKPWTTLNGATMDGAWTLRITDRWPRDNGFVFSWNIAFNPSGLANCDGQVIQ